MFKKNRNLLFFVLIINFVVSVFADTTKFVLNTEYLVEGNVVISTLENSKLFYRISGEGRVNVLDINDISNIKFLQHIDINAYHFAVKNNYIYFTEENFFVISDIFDYSNPIELSRADCFRTGYLFINDNYAIVKNYGNEFGTCGIKLFSISNINNIDEIGSWFHDDVDEYSLFLNGSMEVVGHYLFFSGAIIYPGETGQSLVQVFDISDPANIKDVAKLELPYSFTPYTSSMAKIAYTNGYLYMANGFAGLEIINIEDPEHLYIEANYPTSSSIENIYAEDNTVYISYETEFKLDILDVTEPLKPVLMHTDIIYPSWNIRNNVTSNDKYVFVTGYDETFSQCRFHILEKTVVPSYNIPHIDWSSQWSSYLIVDNGGKDKGNVRLFLYDKEGNELSMTTYEVEGYKTVKIPLEEGECGKVDVFGDNILLKESFVNNEEGGIAEFALTNQSKSEITYLLPSYNSENLTWMGIALMNPSDGLATVTLKAYDNSGVKLGEVSGEIKSNTRSVGLLTSYFPDIDYKQVSIVKVESDKPVAGITISGNGNKQLLFTSANTNTYQTGTLNISHIATQWNDWQNTLIFNNTDETEKATATLNLYDTAGTKTSYDIELNPMETKVLNLNEYSSLTPNCGTVENNSEKVAVRQSFISKSQGGTAEFVLTSTVNAGLLYSFPTYTSDILTWYGLSLFNPTSQEQTCNFKAYFQGELVDTYSCTILPFTRIVGLLTDFFGEISEIDKVTVKSSGNVTGINISGSNWDRLLFTNAFPINIVYEEGEY